MAGELNRFRRVLHVREVEREITQSELGMKLREEEKILSSLDVIQTKRDNALSEFCSGRETLVSPQQLWFERQNIDIIEKTIEGGRERLARCRADIEDTKTDLIEKHRNVQLMEHHVGKLKAREDKKVLAAEQRNLDDITSMRYLRNIHLGRV
jgi:flagellar export protein FliJ